MDDDVTKLPVRFKQRAPDRTLVRPFEVLRGTKCSHLYVTYLIDESSAEVECGQCGEKLNPMWVLRRLANEDRRFAEAHETYQDEMRRLNERSRAKCEHCGKMTRIRLR